MQATRRYHHIADPLKSTTTIASPDLVLTAPPAPTPPTPASKKPDRKKPTNEKPRSKKREAEDIPTDDLIQRKVFEAEDSKNAAIIHNMQRGTRRNPKIIDP